MKFNIFGMEISFSFWFFAALTVFAAFDRATLALYLLLPIAIHELGHILALFACGIKIDAISFRAFGIDIKRSAISSSYARDAAVCAAGVAANLLTALFLYLLAFQSMRVIFFIAVNTGMAVFNAMPVANLDGGQLLRLLLERYGTPARAYAISRVFSLVLLAPLFGAAFFLMLRGFANVSLMAACLYLAGVVIFKE